jgi:hypothetical protein
MKKIHTYFLAALLLFVSTIANAQTPGFTDDVQDVPVDNGVVPMLIVGILFVFWAVRIKHNTIKQNK